MPLFWNISPFVASPYLQMSEAYYAGKNWPYSYAFTSGRQTYFGIFDSGTPYWEAVAKNNMMNNPFYIPYIPLNVGPETGVSDSDIAATHNMANKDILSAKYSALGSNLATLLSNIDRALTSADLTPNQKAALESKKQEVEELLERQKAFARKSANMDVMDALGEVNAMYKEYNDLNTSVGDIMQSIQAGEDVEQDMTPEQIAQEYETTTKPAIEELLSNPQVTQEERDAIEAKQKELEKAIADNKSQAELNKLRKELQDLIDGVNTRLHPDDEEGPVVDHDTPETLSAAQIKEKIPEIKDEVAAIKDDDNVSSSTKSKIEGKLRELKNAIRQNKSEEEIQKLYKELNYMITNAEYESEIKQLDADTHISADDKKAIKDKYKEIEKAIRAGKSPEEIQALYDELDDMIADAKDDVSRVTQREDAQETSDKEKAQERYNKFKEVFNNTKIAKGKELNSYLTPNEKKEFNDLQAKYKKAVEENKPASELNALITQMYDMTNNHIKAAAKRRNVGSNIAHNINEAESVPYSWHPNKILASEEQILEQVQRINGDNVIAVMQAWYDGPYMATNTDGKKQYNILETIASEFGEKDYRKPKPDEENSSKDKRPKFEKDYDTKHPDVKNCHIQYKLVDYILRAIQDYAKANGLEYKAGRYITDIRSEFRRGNKDSAYKIFNNMLKQVFNIPADEISPALDVTA